ncbi:YqhV family protein [Bacillus sp. OAE603]|uniref:YqhV family protein n=1 Tax=Gottfriedia TaxID=2837503 RepID=UPI00178A7A4E
MKQWIDSMDKAVLGMGLLRVVGGSLELMAAITILYFNDIKKALALNSILATVGPIILISTMTIGIIGVASELDPIRLVLVFCGVFLILLAVFK